MGFLSLTIITEQNIYFKNLQGSSHRPRAAAELTAQKAADSFPPEEGGEAIRRLVLFAVCPVC